MTKAKLGMTTCSVVIERLPLTADEVESFKGKRIKLTENDEIILETPVKFFQIDPPPATFFDKLRPRLAKMKLNYENGLILAALGNPIILCNIFSHLDHKTFQACRIVCATWADAVESDLKTRSRVKFDLYPQDLTKASAQLSFLQKFGIPHISFQKASPSLSIPPPHQQFLHDLFQKFGPHFQTLVFSPSLQTQEEISLLKSILKNCQNLKEFSFPETLWTIPSPDRGFEPLPSVKKIQFHKSQINYPEILSIFPSCKELEFSSANPALTFLNSNSTPTLNTLKALKISNPPEFGEQFTHNYLYHYLYNLAQPQFPQLSFLELHDLEFLYLNEWIFSAICHKFSKSLKSLKLSLKLNAKPEDSQLEFPKMPYLQHLSLKMESGTSKLLFAKICPGFNHNYFPALQSLALDLNTEAFGVEAFIANNFTKGIRHKNEIVTKIKFVFPTLEIKLGLLEVAERRMKSSFPNAEQDFASAK